ncbi:glycine oxidase ThiO [Patulibacter sp. SYSU D01012]|uniref:glycine oxidase ThiO n=1 Tax=Patulibacter sp. SYSU D01012 TaxID=2817381 RepID=UPI001B3169F2|nr:glycine oxidase ThiO [Patulibacter sp. SYSU D01012]
MTVRPTVPPTPDVLVVGAGLAGLPVALELLRRGARVTVVDRDAPGRGASHVAAGMLAPVTEAEPDDPDHLALGLAALARWPAYAAALGAAAGAPVTLRGHGALVVARDRDEAELIGRFADVCARFGLDVERLLPSAARRLEPALAPTLRGAVAVPGEQAADPRAVVAALADAVRAAGGELRTGTAVARLLVRDGATEGVALADGTELRAGHVVLAAGAWSGTLPGVPDAARVPVRPVKGQLLLLRDPAGPGLVERVLRFGGAGSETGRYLVPRDDGRYVLGATTEERGHDRTVTAWGVHDLLRDGAELVPGLLDLQLHETIAGLRPTTPDGLPAIGPAAGVDRLWWATGHHRNGVLFASLTGVLLADALVPPPLPASADAPAGAPPAAAPTDPPAPDTAALRALVDPRRPALRPRESARAR